jgi:heptosyltransferase-1
LAFNLQFNLNDDSEAPPLRILIVRVGSMGDVLHGMPAVAALREKIPDCFIGWAVEPRWKDLLVSEDGDPPPIVSRIHEVPTSRWKKRAWSPLTLIEIIKLRNQLKAEKYDACIDLQGSIKSSVVGRMAGAEYFLGPAKPAEPQARLLYREKATVYATHVIEQACELITAALTDSRDPLEVLRPVEVTIPRNSAAEAWCDTRLQELGVGDAGFVLLAPTAGWGAKQWPAEKYRELAGRLRAEGYTVLVNAASAADLELTNFVAADGAAAVVECDLAQLIALTRRARLVVGGDSGPVHLAGALGRPVVGLYGPTDPRRNGPYFPGSRVRVLRHDTSRLDHARHAETEAGLARITEDEVIAAAFGLLGERPSGEVRAGG